jgi:hypothetical protein
MLKPVCVACQRFYRPERNGTAFLEMMPRDGDERARPGKAEPERWTPYELWLGDLWKCAGCGHEIIVGTGWRPVARHYEPDFETKVAAYGAPLRVNDC